jgi:hypothetical protein
MVGFDAMQLRYETAWETPRHASSGCGVPRSKTPETTG